MYQVYQVMLANEFDIIIMMDFTYKLAKNIYAPTYLRYSTWLMGVILGYILYRKKETPSKMSTVS